MAVVSCDGPSFSGLAWTFKLLPSEHTETSMWSCSNKEDHTWRYALLLLLLLLMMMMVMMVMMMMML